MLRLFTGFSGPSSFWVEPPFNIAARGRALWACAQPAFEPVHMSTGRLLKGMS